jgi:hypothetical protein
MSDEQKDPRLLEEVGDLGLWVFVNQIGLLYIAEVLLILCKGTKIKSRATLNTFLFLSPENILSLVFLYLFPKKDFLFLVKLNFRSVSW